MISDTWILTIVSLCVSVCKVSKVLMINICDCKVKCYSCDPNTLCEAESFAAGF